jgi:hypothetical protein
VGGPGDESQLGRDVGRRAGDSSNGLTGCSKVPLRIPGETKHMDINLIVGFVELVGIVAIVQGILLSARARVAAEAREQALGNSMPERPADRALVRAAGPVSQRR